MSAPRAYARTVARACDPVAAAVDLGRERSEHPPCAAALGRPRRLDRARRGRGRGRQDALERVVREPRRRLRPHRAEAAEQPHGLVERGRTEPRAAYAHVRVDARSIGRRRVLEDRTAARKVGAVRRGEQGAGAAVQLVRLFAVLAAVDAGATQTSSASFTSAAATRVVPGSHASRPPSSPSTSAAVSSLAPMRLSAAKPRPSTVTRPGPASGSALPMSAWAKYAKQTPLAAVDSSPPLMNGTSSAMTATTPLAPVSSLAFSSSSGGASHSSTDAESHRAATTVAPKRRANSSPASTNPRPATSTRVVPPRVPAGGNARSIVGTGR